MTKGHHQNHW